MDNFKIFFKNKWTKFILWTLIYVLWFVVWAKNYWFLLGVPVIYDIFISKLIYKKFGEKHKLKKESNATYRKAVEWVDTIVFAVVVASLIRIFFFEMFVIPTSSMERSLLVGDYLCVSKLSYGPKLPNTPLTFPFVHHTMPLTRDVPSFVEWIKRPYKRIVGLDTVSRDDVVVFNFPAGDSVALIEPQQNYYELCRRYGREYINRSSKVIYRPVDKRENYIKRCVAIAGDTLQIIKGQVFVNGVPQMEIPGRQFMYEIQTSTPINPQVFDRMRIAKADIMHSGNMYYLPLTDSMAREIKALGNVVAMNKMALDQPSISMFPHNVERYPWSEDMYGPLWVPRKGATVALTLDNLPLYERIIDVYENHDLSVENGVIYIDGKAADSYTFEMNYYFMMGDNRHNSADSRYWGFVPEDHIVGRASFVWLSLDKERSLFNGKIRFDRMFRKIK